MADTEKPQATPAQRVAVLTAADHNLKLVIDQVQTVETEELKPLIQLLRDADAELDRQRGA